MAATIANVNRDPKRRSDPFEPEDFMPVRPRPVHVMTPEEGLQQIIMLNAILGGEDLRGAA